MSLIKSDSWLAMANGTVAHYAAILLPTLMVVSLVNTIFVTRTVLLQLFRNQFENFY